MAYQLLAWGGVKNLVTNEEIPPDPANSHWQEYQAWLAEGNVAAPVPAPDPITIYNQKLAAGCQIVSTATPALNGTYAIDERAQQNISGIAAGIAARNRVPGGGATFTYPDQSGAMHAFTAADFLNLASAIEDYVYALSNGQAPAQPITIP